MARKKVTEETLENKTVNTDMTEEITEVSSSK